MPGDKVPPSLEGYAYRVTGWCKEAIEESEAFLRAQRGFNKIDQAIDSIMSESPDRLRPSYLSATTCNQAGKAFIDLTAGMTDIKPFWEYRTFNRRFEKTTSIYGKLSTHYWLQSQMDFEFMSGIQNALAAGTTYI